MSATAATTQQVTPTGLPSRRSFRIWLAILAVFLVIGAVSGVMVLVQGLGITGLTDTVPWGLWIALDLSAISLGAGAFILSAIVYLLRVERFKAFARVAVLVGFLGYSTAMLALFLDIGRPDRFWHPVVYWNVHSVLWEVTMCVMLYFTVLATEMAPVVLESRLVTRRWPNAPKIGHAIHKATPVLAVLGLGLSLLHQSSLGATYGVIAARPLWYKPSLPVMFILSAAGGGIAASVLGTLVVSGLRNRYVIDIKVIREVAIFAGSAMALYLYIKIWDWATTTYYSSIPARAEGLALLTQTTPYGTTFWIIEVLLGGLVPIIIFFSKRLRENDWWLALGCVLTIIGVIMLRWNVTISGLVLPQDWSPGVAFLFPRISYVPTLPEIGAFVGIVAYALAGFTLAVHYLPIFPDREHEHGHD